MLHYKKDGSLDMRYSSSKQAASSAFTSTSSCRPSASRYASSQLPSYNEPASYGSTSARHLEQINPCHYKKDGTLDMRYTSSRQAVASERYPDSLSASHSDQHFKKDGTFDMRYTSSRQAVAAGSSRNPDLHYKKDGTLDMRYTSSRQAVASEYKSEHYPSSRASDADQHYKKDGTLDMRYTSSRQAINGSTSSSYNPNPQIAGTDLHYKNDGTLDMRYTSSKQAAASGLSTVERQLRDIVIHNDASTRKYSSIPDSVPKKKDGTPDMRTRAAKAWVADQAAAFQRDGQIPTWVPTKKDGTVDVTKAVGRVFLGCRQGDNVESVVKEPARENYWRKRMEDVQFLELLKQQRMERVVPQRQPRHHDQFMPDDIELINYGSLVLDRSRNGILGQGGFGIVFKATWRGQKVAVKKIRTGDDACESKRKEFKAELSILAHIGRHDNLIQLYGYCMDPMCIVMELVDLGSISHLLYYCEDQAIEVKMTDGRVKKNLMIDVIDGMNHLHNRRVIHGDLKPQNILVTKDFRAKVADFGLATVRGNTTCNIDSATITDDDGEPAFICGTAAYMAPELLDSRPRRDFPSDVYSFGIFLNEVICEEQPYSDQVHRFRGLGRDPFVIARHAKNYGARPTINRRLTSPELEQLIQRSWSASAARRPTFRDLAVEFSGDAFIINSLCC